MPKIILIAKMYRNIFALCPRGCRRYCLILRFLFFFAVSISEPQGSPHSVWSWSSYAVPATTEMYLFFVFAMFGVFFDLPARSRAYRVSGISDYQPDYKLQREYGKNMKRFVEVGDENGQRLVRRRKINAEQSAHRDVAFLVQVRRHDAESALREKSDRDADQRCEFSFESDFPRKSGFENCYKKIDG